MEDEEHVEEDRTSGEKEKPEVMEMEHDRGGEEGILSGGGLR